MVKLGTLLQICHAFGARDGLRRLGYEVQLSSGLMSRRMQRVQGWEHWDLKKLAPDSCAEDLLNLRRQGHHPFFFSNVRTLAPEITRILDAEAQKSTIREADNILAGELPFFGELSYACGFPPNWFQNPGTGQFVEPQRPWTRMRFASRPGPADYGDLKFILEPSRFLFVYPLARAYAISSDERFPEAFWCAVEDWFENSAPMSGPLWICGQESCLRIMAWSFALYAFLHSSTTTPRRISLLLSMIAAHAWRTLQTVGYARSQRSNHLFSEGVGLWTAGTLYPELQEAATWQRHGIRLVCDAVRDQITPEGILLQDSFNYQRMVLQQLFWMLRLAEIHNIDLDPEIRVRATAGLEFVSKFVDDTSGRVPNHGSNDGSYILPLDACGYRDFRPLLRMGSCVLNRLSPLPPGLWDETALWLRDKPDATVHNQPPGIGSTAAGYHRIGTINSWAFIRAGRYTRRPFQADQLHVDLWWHGHNLARDAGTYLYNGQPPWDNGLAGTAVHNTVMVDHRDQMRRAGRFLWLDWAQASGKSLSSPNAKLLDRFEGEHDGYSRLGVTHWRTVQLVTEDAWVIIDDLLGANHHDLRLHWLLPDLPVEVMTLSPFCAAVIADRERICWNFFGSASGNTGIIRGGKKVAGNLSCSDESQLGWESPTYGKLCPAISLLHEIRASLPVRMVTVILAGEALQLRMSEDELSLSLGTARVYQVRVRPAEITKGDG